MVSFFLGKTEEKAGAVSAAAPSESDAAATAAKKEEAPEVSAAPAGAQSAPVERQDSRQPGQAGKHQRLGKTNSSGSQAGDRQAGQPGDNRQAKPEGPVRQTGGPGGGQQHRGPASHKRTEGPKSPVTSAK